MALPIQILKNLNVVKNGIEKQFQPAGIDMRLKEIYAFVKKEVTTFKIVEKIWDYSFKMLLEASDYIKLEPYLKSDLLLLSDDEFNKVDKVSNLDLIKLDTFQLVKTLPNGEVITKEFYKICSGDTTPATYIARFEYVKIPEDCLGLAFPRSTLLRHGIQIVHTIFDPGYEGEPIGLLIVYPIVDSNGIRKRCVTIEKGARLSQLVLIKCIEKPEKTYEGTYKGEKG